MRHPAITEKPTHLWDVYVSPCGKCYIVRDNNLVLEVFRIGKIEGVYKEEGNEQHFVIYRKLMYFSFEDGLQRKDMLQPDPIRILENAKACPIIMEFYGGEGFHKSFGFYRFARSIDELGEILEGNKKILTLEDSKKCWEIFMKHFNTVHLLNGKANGLESRFALGRSIGIALDLEPETSEKHWELMQKLHFN